jgi:hypothetical protein
LKNDLLSAAKDWQMQRVVDRVSGLALDMIWVCVDELLRLAQERGARRASRRPAPP